MREPVRKPNIVEVYEFYELRIDGPDRGGWRKAQCPLPEHDDKNPSASIHEDEGKWHCHACSESGDGLDIIMRREDVGLPGAITFADQFAHGDGPPVRSSGGGSGLLPRRSGHRPGRSNWTPPWKGL